MAVNRLNKESVMAIDYEKLLKKTPAGNWYTGEELRRKWGVGQEVQRARVQALVKKGIFARRGKTANVQYKYLLTKKKSVAPTGNGVIDAKLRKEAGLPNTPTSLEELINAATKLGTENEILKSALYAAKATIEKALEST
jgi:hypothetical protein